jgi:hypothetical protein
MKVHRAPKVQFPVGYNLQGMAVDCQDPSAVGPHHTERKRTFIFRIDFRGFGSMNVRHFRGQLWQVKRINPGSYFQTHGDTYV